MESELKIYSLGIVVETKPENTDIILVTPIEVFNIQEPGLIKEKYKKLHKGDLPDIEDKVLETEIKSANYLRAKWLPIETSNRVTPPDVVRGETVLLFKFSNIDEYYWTTIFREPELRRLEEVLYSYSNLKKGIEKYDKNSSYWIEYNTKKKFIHLHTSDNDGELSSYDIRINTKDGILTILDKQKNEIKLNSVNSVLEITTNSNVVINSPAVVLNGNVYVNGNLNCSGNISADGSIIDAGGNTNNHSHP